jgi:DNA polymerase III delta prime subunit
VDFTELNSADFRGIDMVRDIRTRIPLAPIGGKCRVWLIDEAHQLTKDAQTALLKMMEDTPSHVYFMIATTESGKLLPAIVNRCVSIKVKKLKNKEVADVLMQVCRKEWNTDAGEKFTDEVLDKVVELSEGCPRAAVQLLESVVDVEDADSQVECLERSEFKSESIELCRALLNERNRWPEVAALLKGLDVDPEKMRRMVLGYMTSVILGGKNAKRAFLVIQAFRDNFFDSGKAGLVAACYEVVVGG